MNTRTTASPANNKVWLGATLVEAATVAARADSADVTKLIADLQSPDDLIRGAAWQGAGPLGAPAVKSLAGVMVHKDFEIARAAKRALWKIVRKALGPAAEQARKAVQAELIDLLKSTDLPVRREVVWMLSEIGDESVVAPLAELLGEVGIREDVRCALERLPSPKASRALEEALNAAPEDFRPALANSLRVRGRRVAGYPSKKLSPRKPTTVQAK